MKKLLINSVAYLVFVPFILPVWLFINLFWRVRLGHLREGRMGEVAGWANYYLRQARQDREPRRTLTIFPCWNPANRQIIAMLKRKVKIVESRLLARFLFAIRPLIENTFLYYSEFGENLWRAPHITGQGGPVLEFSTEEKKKGQTFLSNIGIGSDDWFVCFHSRDSSYLSQREGNNTVPPAKHYRDCNISDYLPAAQWIGDQGGYALRMGAITSEAMPDIGPKVVEYSQMYRNDFLDIYLLGNCRFFLGNTSAPWVVAALFNKPLALANYCSFKYCGIGPRTLFTPKLLRRIEDGEVLSFPEIKCLGLFDPDPKLPGFGQKLEFYSEAKLEWIDNTPEDIVDLCRDMIDLLDGREQTEEICHLQETYRNFYSGPNNHELAGGIGPRFALKHKHLINPVTAETS